MASAKALSAPFAPVAFASSSSDRQTSSIARRCGTCVSNARALHPLLSLSSAELPTTSGRLTPHPLNRAGRRGHRKPLSRPPRVAEKPSSSSATPSSSAWKPLAPGSFIQQLPLFPLNLVAFPHADVPLHIFEARYVKLSGNWRCS